MMRRRPPVGIFPLIISCCLLVGAECLQLGEMRMRGKPERNRKSALLECTEALNSWSYFAKTSVKKLLDDEFKKKEYIFFLGTLVPQIDSIDESLNACKNELLKYNVSTGNEMSQLKLELKSRGEREMVINDERSAREALKRIEELNERSQLINEAKKLVSDFDSRDICTECKLFASQIALISLLKRLKLMYNSYIVELESKIDPKILEK